jgi:hypothetical protein
MRWCKNCGKVNGGWPARCRYCSVGLDGRLCTRGHVNPTDARLSFCGDCGQPLERKSGAGFSAAPYLLASAVLVSTVALCALITFVPKENSPMTALLALLILIFGLRFVFQILPPAAKNITRGVVDFFLRVVLGTGNKG